MPESIKTSAERMLTYHLVFKMSAISSWPQCVKNKQNAYICFRISILKSARDYTGMLKLWDYRYRNYTSWTVEHITPVFFSKKNRAKLHKQLLDTRQCPFRVMAVRMRYYLSFQIWNIPYCVVLDTLHVHVLFYNDYWYAFSLLLYFLCWCTMSNLVNSLSPDRRIKKLILNDRFCQHIVSIFCEITLGCMPIILSQHWFR